MYVLTLNSYNVMSHDWFMTRLGKRVLLEMKNGQWKEVEIASPEDAQDYHTMSCEGYSFTDLPQSENICVACEG